MKAPFWGSGGAILTYHEDKTYLFSLSVLEIRVPLWSVAKWRGPSVVVVVVVVRDIHCIPKTNNDNDRSNSCL